MMEQIDTISGLIPIQPGCVIQYSWKGIRYKPICGKGSFNYQ